MTYQELVQRSKEFFRNNRGCKIQTSANLIENLPQYSDDIERFAGAAYPVIHEDVVQLIEEFLEMKKKHGSGIEKKIYEGMTFEQFVDRLICKRPLAFLTAADSWLTKQGDYGAGSWGEIGTDEEGETYQVLKMQDYLTYDEIKISALLQINSPVVTINSGSRDNIGRPGHPGTFLEQAVYAGAVGARFEMAGRMEYQDMLVTERRNTRDNGYGPDNAQAETGVLGVFSRFYGVSYFHTYDEAEKLKDQYIRCKGDFTFSRYLNTEIYIKRIQTTAETFLLSAEMRGAEAGQDVYCHVVGLGLGVWKVSSHQNKYFLLGWERSLEQLSLTRVKDVDFSWIAKNDEVKLKHGESFNGIKIHFSRRNPFDLLPEPDKKKLVVAMFAWDGNSYVGNEYWEGQLSASGDPAAAACSTIPELMNPDINNKICGQNIKIASKKKGVISYEDYISDATK